MNSKEAIKVLLNEAKKVKNGLSGVELLDLFVIATKDSDELEKIKTAKKVENGSI